MIKTKPDWKLYFLFALVLAIVVMTTIPSGTSWSGPPPAEIVYYGYAYINGSYAADGTALEIRSNNGSLVMDTDTILTGGYFPELKLIWDDPDTPGDEGIEYASNAEKIYYTVGGEYTNYPEYRNVTTGEAGKSILINLSFIYNFPPILITIPNQTVLEDSSLVFYVDAWDNNSYREDVLSFFEDSPGTLTNTSQIYVGNNTWRTTFTWTPDNWDVGNHTYNFSVYDDGIPQKSDDQLVNIEVINTNDPPYINPSNQVVFLGTTLTYTPPSGDDDLIHGDVLFYDYNTSLFTFDNSTGKLTFTPNSSHIGVHSISVNVTDLAGVTDTETFTITVKESQDIIIVKNIIAVSETEYDVEITVYNYEEFGNDLFDLTINDTDLNLSETFNLTYRSFISFNGTVTFSGAGVHNFSIAEVNNSGDMYYSNEPSIYVTVCTACSSGGGGGGGGGGSVIIRPVNATCDYQVICEEWDTSKCKVKDDGKIKGEEDRRCVIIENDCEVSEISQEQSCAACTPQWECTAWSPEECSGDGGQLFRTCTDVDDCGTLYDKPDEIYECPIEAGIQFPGASIWDMILAFLKAYWPWLLLALAVMLLVWLFPLFWRRKPPEKEGCLTCMEVEKYLDCKALRVNPGVHVIASTNISVDCNSDAYIKNRIYSPKDPDEILAYNEQKVRKAVKNKELCHEKEIAKDKPPCDFRNGPCKKKALKDYKPKSNKYLRNDLQRLREKRNLLKRAGVDSSAVERMIKRKERLAKLQREK